MVSGVLQRLLAPGHRVRAQALTGSFLLLSHLSQVLLMLPGTALPLLTDLMPPYPGLMQSTALGKKSICKSLQWCWIPRVGSSKDCGRGRAGSDPADGAALRQTGGQQLCGVCSLCVSWGSDTATNAQLQPTSRTSKGCLLQRHWRNAGVVGSTVRMVGN